MPQKREYDDIPRAFAEQQLLSDEKFLWLGTPNVTRIQYNWLVWKYKDLTIPLVVFGVVAVAALIAGSTEYLVTFVIGMLCFTAVFYNLTILRVGLAFFTMHYQIPTEDRHYAISDHNMFYRIPGKKEVYRVPIRDIRRYTIKANNDGTSTFQFYCKHNFRFEHVANEKKLTKLIDYLIQKNQYAMSKRRSAE